MKNAPSTFSHEPIKPHMHNPEEDDIVVTRKIKKQWTTMSFGDDYIMYLMDDIPRTIEEVYSSPDAVLWKEGVWSEIDSIMSNGT